MEKVILIIEKPTCCAGCVLCKEARKPNYYICNHLIQNGEDCVLRKIEDIESKPNWCPLKELPIKKVEKSVNNVGLRDVGFIDGYNACVDYILN